MAEYYLTFLTERSEKSQNVKINIIGHAMIWARKVHNKLLKQVVGNVGPGSYPTLPTKTDEHL